MKERKARSGINLGFITLLGQFMNWIRGKLTSNIVDTLHQLRGLRTALVDYRTFATYLHILRLAILIRKEQVVFLQT